MSYCRLPYQIYPTKEGIKFDLDTISHDKIDVFLYKIFLTRKDELIDRIKHGKEISMKWQDDQINGNNYKELVKFYKELGYSDEKVKEMTQCCKSESVIQHEKEYKQWLLDKEDEFFKEFIKEKEVSR